MKKIGIYILAAAIIAGTALADTTPALASPVTAPLQSRPKPPPPPPDPLHIFSKKRPQRPRVKTPPRHKRLTFPRVKLPPPPPAPPHP